VKAIFHLAIPTHDLELAESFYVNVMGARKARKYADRVTFELCQHQIVCHLAPDDIVEEITIYPRHFGLTYLDRRDFEGAYLRIKEMVWTSPTPSPALMRAEASITRLVR
jgi:uncharacterized protein